MSSTATAQLLRRFLQSQRKARVYSRLWGFRKFAQSLGFARGRWQAAVHHVLSLPKHEAHRTMDAFRTWLQRGGLSTPAARQCMYTVRPFFEFAYKAGVIPWRLQHRKRDLTEARWKRSGPEFHSLGRRWLDYLTNLKYTENTLRAYRNELLKFGEYLAGLKRSPRSITYETAASWLRTCHAAAAPVTAEHRVSTAKMFCEWLVAVKVLRRNGFRVLPHRQRGTSMPRHVSEEAILRLIHAASDLRDRALIEVLYATGCRVSEVSGLDLALVSLENRRARCMGKGLRERVVYLNRPAVRAICAYLPERALVLKRLGRENEPALFVNYFGTRLLPGTMSGDVLRVARKAGMDGISPHVIRHSFATHLLNRGASFDLLMRLLGHSSLVSTAIYAHLQIARVRKDYRKARPRR